MITEESDLIFRAVNGDGEAYERVVKENNESLLGFIRGFGQSFSDAEDIAQEVWVKAWRHIDSYDPQRGKFRTWIYGIARHEVNDRWAKKSKEQIRFLNEAEGCDILAAQEAKENTPLSLLLKEEMLYQMHLVYCEFFHWLFYCGGYPHEQLAYGFAKLIYGKKSERTIEGNPDKVDANFGSQELGRVAELFLQAYKTASGITASWGPSCTRKDLEPLYKRIRYKVKELRQPLPTSLETIQDVIVAQTHLKDYYVTVKNRRTHPITDWCYRVERQLRRVIARLKNVDTDNHPEQTAQASFINANMKICPRCKLRHLEPCLSGAKQKFQRLKIFKEQPFLRPHPFNT
jgi:RNA polymerase sigma factor (sigma-70 family)